MISVYANIVINGIKTLEDVPEKLRLAVEMKVKDLTMKKQV